MTTIYMNILRLEIIDKVIISLTRVNDSRIRILQDPAGKKRGNHRILQESTGNLLDFSPVNSSQFPAGTGQKSSGNGRKISGGNTASGMNRNFAGSHRFLPYVFDPGSFRSLVSSSECISDPDSVTLEETIISGVFHKHGSEWKVAGFF